MIGRVDWPGSPSRGKRPMGGVQNARSFDYSVATFEPLKNQCQRV